MNIRALAPIGALGLGALAVTWFDFGSAVSPPPDVRTSTSRTDRRSKPGRPATEPTPGPHLTSLTRSGGREPQTPAPAPRVRRSTLAQLGRQPGWGTFLKTWCALPPEADPHKRLAGLRRVYANATNPVVRQNLIFLAALVLPTEVSQAWLEGLRAGPDPDDAEDALCALAFSGEPVAQADFLQLAHTPAAAKVHRIIDDGRALAALGRQGTPAARGILRSYHCIEACDRSPYFHITAHEASGNWGSESGFGERLGWVDGYTSDPEAVARLHVAFLDRYPGHPISDDLARRIARHRLEQGELLEAVRWFSHSATLPDQDKAYSSAAHMAVYCEMVLTPEQVQSLAHDQGLQTPNRTYFLYVWLRRLAAERGFETALREWEALAAREPGTELAVAWALRETCPPCKGLDSGVTPLPADDRLRRVVPARVSWPPARPAGRWRPRVRGLITGRAFDGDKYRLEPWPEVVQLDRGHLVGQARAWGTLAELARRTDQAQGLERADLLYKQAALYYHDRDVLFPAYGGHTVSFRSLLQGRYWAWNDEKKRQRREAGLRFEATSFSYLRAVALFEQIEREHSDYRAMDKVLFSLGLAWRQLLDYRPFYSWSPELDARWNDRRDPAIREIVRNFDRCVARCPASALSHDARAASAYWRRTIPRAFKEE